MILGRLQMLDRAVRKQARAHPGFHKIFVDRRSVDVNAAWFQSPCNFLMCFLGNILSNYDIEAGVLKCLVFQVLASNSIMSLAASNAKIVRVHTWRTPGPK